MSAPTADSTWDAATSEAALAAGCAELVADATTRAPGCQAEAFGVHRQAVTVGFEKGDLKLTHVDESTSYGLRVIREQRQGFASTNQGDRSATVEDALTLARLCPPDEAHGLPAPRPLPERPSLVHPGTAAFPIEEAVERARAMVAAVTERDPRLSLDKADLDVSRSSVALAASNGAAASESDASLSVSLFGMAVDGDDVGGFDVVADLVRDPAELPAAIERVVQRFAENALGNLGAGAAESYQGPVLFAPAAFLSVFLSPLIGAASAQAIQRGRSPLAGKLGEAVAAPLLTIVDDPSDRTLAGAAGFDREGQPAVPTPLVQDGVLRCVLHNAYSAAVDGVTTTGHASGGSRSVPGIGPHALAVSPGAGGDRDDLLATLGRGLLVQRFSGTVDPTSGDFSGVAKSARWVEGGRVLRPVRETLLQGNAFQLLPRLLALSSTSDPHMGRHRVPWALADGVAVTAG